MQTKFSVQLWSHAEQFHDTGAEKKLWMSNVKSIEERLKNVGDEG